MAFFNLNTSIPLSIFKRTGILYIVVSGLAIDSTNIPSWVFEIGYLSNTTFEPKVSLVLSAFNLFINCSSFSIALLFFMSASLSGISNNFPSNTLSLTIDIELIPSANISSSIPKFLLPRTEAIASCIFSCTLFFGNLISLLTVISGFGNALLLTF